MRLVHVYVRAARGEARARPRGQFGPGFSLAIVLLSYSNTSSSRWSSGEKSRIWALVLIKNFGFTCVPTPYHINDNRRFQPRPEPSGGRPSQVVQRQKPLAEAERMA